MTIIMTVRTTIMTTVLLCLWHGYAWLWVRRMAAVSPQIVAVIIVLYVALSWSHAMHGNSALEVSSRRL